MGTFTLSNKHRQYGVHDPTDDLLNEWESSMCRRIKAALQVPSAPECIDGFTERDLSILSRHIAIRLTRFGK